MKIPDRFAPAIGKARAEDHKTYTVIRVPLVGTYRGLRTREIVLYGGHSNGINATHILFDASRQEIEKVLGPDLAQVRQGWDEGDYGFVWRAEVVSRGKGADLICDTST